MVVFMVSYEETKWRHCSCVVQSINIKITHDYLNCEDWQIRSDNAWHGWDTGTLGEWCVPKMYGCGAVISLRAVLSTLGLQEYE